MTGAISRENDRMVHVGANSQVSMQVLQDIYNDITGKSEKLTQTVSANSKVEMEDLCQLNSKIRQMYEQYHIVSENCSVTIYHSNDSKERFSSFERFRMYDGSSLNPVENVSLEYSFLIILPKLDRPQPYKIELNITSRAGLAAKIRREPGMGSGFFHFISLKSAAYEIEYIDYTVARNFKAAIDQWFSALNTTKDNRLIKLSKKISDYFPLLFKSLTAGCISTSIYFGADDWFQKHGEGGASVFTLGLFAFSCVYIGSSIAQKLGSLTENWTDRYQSLSYVKLNRGDEVAIQDFKSDERNKIIKIGLGVLLTIGLNVFSSWMYKWLGL